MNIRIEGNSQDAELLQIVEVAERQLEGLRTPSLHGDLIVARTSELNSSGQFADFLTNLLRAGNNIILLDVASEDKIGIEKAIGISAEGASKFLFLGGYVEKDGYLLPLIVDMLESPREEEGRAGETSSGFTDAHRFGEPEGGAERKLDSTEDAAEYVQTGELDTLGYFVRAIVRTAQLASERDSDYPPDLVRAKWIYTIDYPLKCSKRKRWKRFTPQPQNTHGTVTYTIEGFLDEAASGDFQWLYLSAVGFWTTEGMNKNGRSERGWGIGQLGLDIPIPDGFKFVKSSPVNTSKQKSVTTSVGFTVGYKTGSFGFNRSSTENLQEWRVVLENFNRWRYAQELPFDGTTWVFPDDAVGYNVGKMRHELKTWPALAANVLNFETMSVWRNTHTAQNVVFLKPAVLCQYNYIAVDNFWPTWNGYWWGTRYNDSFSSRTSLRVDLARIVR